MLSRFGLLRFLALALGFFLGSTRASAGPINFFVDVDTASLAGTTGSLEFQFASNAAGPPGSATLTDFTSDGTAAAAGPYSFFGNFSGGLPGPLTISETPTQSADIGQDFTFGHDLNFVVSLSEPGAFNLFLWNTTGGNGSILMSSVDPDAGGATVAITVDSNGQTTILTGVGATATLIPAPSSLALFGLASAGLAAWRWRRRRGA